MNTLSSGTTIGTAAFTWAGHGEPTGLPEGLVIFGSKGCIKGDTLYRDGQDPVGLRELFNRQAGDAERERWLPLGLTDTFAAGFYDFLRAVEARRQPEASGDEGLRDLASAFSLIESSLLGQSVAMDDVLTGEVRTAQRDIDAHYGLA